MCYLTSSNYVYLCNYSSISQTVFCIYQKSLTYSTNQKFEHSFSWEEMRLCAQTSTDTVCEMQILLYHYNSNNILSWHSIEQREGKKTPPDSVFHPLLSMLHRCALNSYTQVLMNGNSSTSRISVQIFSIVNLNMIYLHCQVQICVQIGSTTCVPVSTSSIQKTSYKLAALTRWRNVK